ncbi:unnamed protein product, partial [Polarella glacialis]
MRTLRTLASSEASPPSDMEAEALSLSPPAAPGEVLSNHNDKASQESQESQECAERPPFGSSEDKDLREVSIILQGDADVTVAGCPPENKEEQVSEEFSRNCSPWGLSLSGESPLKPQDPLGLPDGQLAVEAIDLESLLSAMSASEAPATPAPVPSEQSQPSRQPAAEPSPAASEAQWTASSASARHRSCSAASEEEPECEDSQQGGRARAAPSGGRALSSSAPSPDAVPSPSFSLLLSSGGSPGRGRREAPGSLGSPCPGGAQAPKLDQSRVRRASQLFASMLRGEASSFGEKKPASHRRRRSEPPPKEVAVPKVQKDEAAAASSEDFPRREAPEALAGSHRRASSLGSSFAPEAALPVPSAPKLVALNGQMPWFPSNQQGPQPQQGLPRKVPQEIDRAHVLLADLDSRHELCGPRDDDMKQCLGELGFVMSVRGGRADVSSTNGSQRSQSWNLCCLKPEPLQAVHCLDLHDHPLIWCTNFPNCHTCDADCDRRRIWEAYRCPKCDFDVCKQCAAQYKPKDPFRIVRTRHHLQPLIPVGLPRG